MQSAKKIKSEAPSPGLKSAASTNLSPKLSPISPNIISPQLSLGESPDSVTGPKSSRSGSVFFPSKQNGTTARPSIAQNELSIFSGEDNEEITARNPVYQEDDEEEDLNPKSGSYYDPQRAAADLATTLSKTSKHIKKGQKKGNSIKEKEKARRMKGQSSISTWKPDLFMKMRQEYD